METPPLPSARAEPVLRPMRAGDIPFAHALRQIAGWNQSEHDWRGYLEFEPDGCFIAEVEGRPAGTATTIRYDDRFGWIGMVLVHPDFRRLGIGTRLLQHAITHLQARGVRCIKLDATPMGRAVYVPLGFIDEYELARLEGTAPAVTGAVSAGVTPLLPADLPAITRLDAAVFGAGRARVLTSLSGRNPEWCVVARTPGGVAGYLIARQGASTVQVGPWVAANAIVAEALLQSFFARAAGRRVFIDVVSPNPAAAAMVRRAGFTVQRTLTRMFLGENAHPGDPARVFGVSSPEKG